MNHHILDAAAIVSGSDVPHDHYDSSSDDDAQVPIQDRDPTEVDMNLSDTDEEAESTKYNIPSKDELYNPNEDEEDEAYVYQHLRGGTEESISIRRKKKENTELEINNGNADANSDKKNSMSAGKEIPNKSTHGSSEQYQHSLTLEQAKVLKPRSSDAVLSCPCCFQIVCMDCQRHERYGNQFRAMFVMNIGVSWDKYISPGNLDNKKEADADVSMDTNVTARPALKKPRNQEDTSGSVTIPLHEAKGDSVTEDPKRDEYFSIHCSNCNTEVAALDMSDEVYHFFGCLVSA
jgi:hypothetical protein